MFFLKKKFLVKLFKFDNFNINYFYLKIPRTFEFDIF